MTLFGIIGVGIILYNLAKKIAQPTLPAEYHRNLTLEAEDANKVRFGQMSQAEFNRNINRGKYR